jgi:hypothetical protein
LGGIYHSVDVNGVLFNALGAWIGYGLFFGFAWLFMVTMVRFKIRTLGLLAYVQTVVDQIKVVEPTGFNQTHFPPNMKAVGQTNVPSPKKRTQ